MDRVWRGEEDSDAMERRAKVACHAGHLTMDTIDEWRTALLELPNVEVAMLDLGEEAALETLIALVAVSIRSDNVVNLKRWNKEMDPKKFVLDMLLPIFGTHLVELFCTKMSIEPPRSVVYNNTPATPEVTKKTVKKSKITDADTKGHRSLTQFFKKKG
ncbi:hypothetical protein PSACC_02648 [Paramicrosporidium saccamoebae]|uniref:Uncharacterized protein n=1 Tax=Paramicrosporidium saccamoebae TaxID=1246581 RepID=A0A2H9TII7_9FUNG|nr:hypothetical protein PSACC_02648 [Paramicrosporidium saccamoebae]